MPFIPSALHASVQHHCENRGSNPALTPLVVMALRSGWWQCASEQGSRLACWLEVIRTVRSGKPIRDCFFVALSGHELGFLGMDPYMKRHPDLQRRSHAWIFFGSDIGAPRQPNLIHASDEGLERWGVAAMEKEGIVVNAKARHDSIARGETVLSSPERGRRELPSSRSFAASPATAVGDDLSKSF
jgi:hypothetical protein